MALEIINALDQITEPQSIQYKNNSDCHSALKNTIDHNEIISIFHINIRSLNKNFDQLLVFLTDLKLKFDVVVCTESWINFDAANTFKINDYNTHIILPVLNKCDGIAIFVKSNLNYTVEKIRMSTCCACKININKINTSTQIVAVYRSPNLKNYPINMFTDEIINELNNLSAKHQILIGDFNIDLTKNSNDVLNYQLSLNEAGFSPAITKPTRVTPYTATLIDHVFVKSVNLLNSQTAMIETTITDHLPIIFYIPGHRHEAKNNPKSYTKTILNYNKLNQYLEKTSWALVLKKTNANDAYDLFFDIFDNVIKSATTTKTFKQNAKNCKLKPWITQGLINSIRKRDDLAKKAKKFPNCTVLQCEYKNYRNYLTKLIRQQKDNYYKNLIQQNKNNLRETWKIIHNSTGGNSEKQDNFNININNTIINSESNPKEVAENFNNFFSNIGEQLAKKIIPPTTVLRANNITANNMSIFLNPIDKAELSNTISELKLNSAPGIDNITATMIKKVKEFIYEPILHIFNLSLETGVFPTALKRTVIIPVFKSGDQSDINNYRPISLTSVFAKLLEKCVAARLHNFLKKNHLIHKSQFGFLKGLSTNDAVTHFAEHVYKNVNDKKKVMSVFLDLKKAFDTVCHKKLLSKLYSYGIRGKAYDFFKNYLWQRMQCTRINNVLSDEKPVTFGVPQGTVLGPILFIIYINDLFDLKINGYFTAYADDTTITFVGNTWKEVVRTVKAGLIIIDCWLRDNLLSLNVSKTMAMPFLQDIQNLEPIVFNNSTLNYTKLTKYLGILVHNKLSWKEHIYNLIVKIRKTIYKFLILRSFLNIATLKMIYYAIIQSVIQYCIVLWGSAFISIIGPLEKAQKGIIKIILKKSRRYSSNLLFQEFKVLTISQLYTKNLLIYTHKNRSVNNILTYPNVTTRASAKENVKVPSFRLKVTRYNFMYLGSRIYNNLDLDIRKITYLNSFKKHVTSWIIRNSDLIGSIIYE